MTKSGIVSVVKSANIPRAVRRAVELCGGVGNLVKKGDTVLLKPNVKNPSTPGYGVITDPRVVAVLIDLAREAEAGHIVVAEGSAYPSGAYQTFASFECKDTDFGQRVLNAVEFSNEAWSE